MKACSWIRNRLLAATALIAFSGGGRAVLAFSSSSLVSTTSTSSFSGVHRNALRTSTAGPSSFISKETNWRLLKPSTGPSRESYSNAPAVKISKAATSALFSSSTRDGNQNDLTNGQKLSLRHFKLASTRINIRNTLRWLFRKVVVGLFCLTTFLSLATTSALAVSGGRMGGSFKSSPGRAPVSRPYRAPNRSYGHQHRPHSPIMMRPYRPRTRMYHRDPGLVDVAPAQQHPYQPFGPTAAYRRRFRPTDVAFVTGAGLLVATKVSKELKKEQDENSSALGPGFSVTKLTVSMSVPNRDAPDSILHKLKRLSDSSRTDTRQGVQRLVSSVALELLRQERSIRSAESKYQHYRNEGAAEHEYTRQSIQTRSKFDRETVNKYGKEDLSDVHHTLDSSSEDSNSKATEAVVTILVSIEGDKTRLPPIKSRDNLLSALNRLAVDAQVDDCLLSAEVSWAPEVRSETLSQQDIYVDYPSLYPL